MALLALAVAALAAGISASAGAAPPRVTGQIGDLAWAPGPQILFDTDRSGVFTIGGDGSGVRSLRGPGSGGASWSPGGRLVALVAGDSLVVLRPDGSGARQLERHVLYAAWAPVGARIATLGGDGYAVVPAAGGRARVVGRQESDESTPPAWSPDGRSLAYGDCVDGSSSACEHHTGGMDVFVVPAAGGGPRRNVTRLGGRVDCVTWAPLAGVQYSGARGTTLVRPDGSGSRRLGRGYGCWSPSPDGRRVAAAGAASVTVFDPVTGRGRQIGRLPAGDPSAGWPEPAVAWSPDGSEIAVVRAVGDASSVSYRLLVVRVRDGRTRTLLVLPRTR